MTFIQSYTVTMRLKFVELLWIVFAEWLDQLTFLLLIAQDRTAAKGLTIKSVTCSRVLARNIEIGTYSFRLLRQRTIIPSPKQQGIHSIFFIILGLCKLCSMRWWVLEKKFWGMYHTPSFWRISLNKWRLLMKLYRKTCKSKLRSICFVTTVSWNPSLTFLS